MMILFLPLMRWRRQLLAVVLAVVAACLLPGCQTDSEKAQKRAMDKHISDILDIDPGDPSPEWDMPEKEPIGGGITPSLDRIPRESTLPTRNLQGLAGSKSFTPYDLAMDMVKDLENPDEQVEVNFKFDGEDLAEVVKQMAAVLDVKYYIDPAVAGTVTFDMEGEMTMAQVWELFAKILWFNDAYITRDEGFIRVMNMEKMPREQRLFSNEAPRDNVMVEMIRFENVAAADMVPLVTPHLSPKASVTPIPHLNSLLIVDTPANLMKLRELTVRLDQMYQSQWPQDSIVCHYVDVAVIAEELKNVLPILGLRVSTGDQADGQSIRIFPLERMQVLIVSAPDVALIDEVRRWVKVLDRQESGEQDQIFFYSAKHTTANELAEVIGFFFNASESKKSSSSGSSSSSTSSEGGSSETLTSNSSSSSSAASRSAHGQAGEGYVHTMVFDIPVSVFVDPKHNRLVIRTTPRAYTTIMALLEALDTPPLQVLIQMSIAEIQLNKDLRYGFQYGLHERIQDGESPPRFIDTGFLYKDSLPTQTDGTGSDGTPSNSAIDFESAGFNFLFTQGLDPYTIFGFIEAIAGTGNTRVLFSPQVLAISDEEALINVGDKVPIVTQENNSDDSTNITREIQYQDTGIIMTVTPHVTANRMVTLDIKQEVSDAVQTTSSSIDSPTIQTRVIETSLVVNDKSTVLLGGLIRTRDLNNNTGIPLLKDIPYLGKLFSLTTVEEQRQELLVLITVNVVDLDTDVERLARRYEAALNAMKLRLDRDFDIIEPQ